MINLERKIDKKLIYTLLALFQLAGAGSKRELCDIAEEITGEKFSDEELKKTIGEIGREVSLGDKIELAKIIQRFGSTMQLVKRKSEK